MRHWRGRLYFFELDDFDGLVVGRAQGMLGPSVREGCGVVGVDAESHEKDMSARRGRRWLCGGSVEQRRGK